MQRRLSSALLVVPGLPAADDESRITHGALHDEDPSPPPQGRQPIHLHQTVC